MLRKLSARNNPALGWVPYAVLNLSAHCVHQKGTQSDRHIWQADILGCVENIGNGLPGTC
jgi:hypothetical protein